MILFTAAVAALAAFLWFARKVLLLAFAGLLISLVFTSLINLFRKVIRLKQALGLVLVLILLLGLAALAGWWIVPHLAEEFSQLMERIPKIVGHLEQQVQGSEWFHRISAHLPNLLPSSSSSTGIIAHVKNIFSSTFNVLAALILLMFVSIFFAANPGLYRQLLLRLVPPARRNDAEAILGNVIRALKYWLLGQFIAMCIVGVLMGGAFALLKVPLAASLGVLAGLAEFIPFLGPTAAAIPALLLALGDSPRRMLVVLGAYLAIQFIEGHLIMPLVQRQTVHLPPVILLLALFFLGEAFSLLGVFVAAPLTVFFLTLVDEIYIRRYLHQEQRLLRL